MVPFLTSETLCDIRADDSTDGHGSAVRMAQKRMADCRRERREPADRGAAWARAH